MLKKLYHKLNLTKILIIGLVVRLISWPWIYHGDVNATYWWGKFASEFSWRGFYDWLNFGGHGIPDQPMINIYYDWLVRQIFLFLNNIFWYLNVHIPIFPSKFMQWFFLEGNQYLLKLPMIITDLVIAYLCFKFTKSKKIALVLALYPPLIYNSAIWGSGDSIVNLFALLTIYLIWKKNYLFSVPQYLVSVLYKPSLFIWAPIILVMLIKNKISFKNVILSSYLTITLIYLICFPFNPVEISPLLWFINVMTTKILPGVMDQITANAMNFWALLYGLKPKIDNFLVFNLISVRLFSLIICCIFYIHQLQKLYKNYSLKSVLFSLVTISMITFTFMTRMHERYTFPALIPLLLLSHFDRRFIKYFIILTITHLLNVYSGWWIPNIPFLINLIDNDLVVRLVSFIHVVITIRLIFLNPDIDKT